MHHGKGQTFIVGGFCEVSHWSNSEDPETTMIYTVRADLNGYISQTFTKFGLCRTFRQISGEGTTGSIFRSSDQRSYAIVGY